MILLLVDEQISMEQMLSIDNAIITIKLIHSLVFKKKNIKLQHSILLENPENNNHQFSYLHL